MSFPRPPARASLYANVGTALERIECVQIEHVLTSFSLSGGWRSAFWRRALPEFGLESLISSFCQLLKFSILCLGRWRSMRAPTTWQCSYYTLFLYICQVFLYTKLVARGGIEPPTQRFSVFRSTTELPGHFKKCAQIVIEFFFWRKIILISSSLITPIITLHLTGS